MVSKRHVSTADEAIIFDLEDQGKLYQEEQLIWALKNE